MNYGKLIDDLTVEAARIRKMIAAGEHREAKFDTLMRDADDVLWERVYNLAWRTGKRCADLRWRVRQIDKLIGTAEPLRDDADGHQTRRASRADRRAQAAKS